MCSPGAFDVFDSVSFAASHVTVPRDVTLAATPPRCELISPVLSVYLSVALVLFRSLALSRGSPSTDRSRPWAVRTIPGIPGMH